MEEETDQYTKDENHLIECVEGMLEYYNMDLKEVISVIEDRVN